MTQQMTEAAWDRTVAQAKAMEAKRIEAVKRERRKVWSQYRRAS